MVALTGVEPANRQFSSVQLGLSGCRFSTVQFARRLRKAPRTAGVVSRWSPGPVFRRTQTARKTAKTTAPRWRQARRRRRGAGRRREAADGVRVASGPSAWHVGSTGFLRRAADRMWRSAVSEHCCRPGVRRIGSGFAGGGPETGTQGRSKPGDGAGVVAPDQEFDYGADAMTQQKIRAGDPARTLAFRNNHSVGIRSPLSPRIRPRSEV